MRRILFSILAFLSAHSLIAQTPIRINEININPDGTDQPFEFAELKCVANTNINNVYFVVIEGDNPNQGVADFVVPLLNVNVGANGIIVIKAVTGGFTPPGGTTTVLDAQLNVSGNGIENGTNTFMLIESSIALTENTDYDVNNDGMLELLPIGAIILDAIAVNDGGMLDVVHTTQVLTTGSVPGAILRLPNNNMANSSAAFYYGSNSSDGNSSLNLPTGRSANFPAGGLLTPGDINAPAANNIPLPVKFANLRAAKKGTAVSVQFSNLTEEDIATYSIERSKPGAGFVEIGRLSPVKNDNTEASYTWEDKAPQTGVNLYRIKAMETSGKQVLSGVLKVDLSGNGTSLQIAPNPVRGQSLGLQVSNLPAGLYQLRIFGANAQAISSYFIQHSGGSLTQSIQLKGLQPGQYVLRLEGAVQMQQSFLVQQ